jgi:hypothetical protein
MQWRQNDAEAGSIHDNFQNSARGLNVQYDFGLETGIGQGPGTAVFKDTRPAPP